MKYRPRTVAEDRAAPWSSDSVKKTEWPPVTRSLMRDCLHAGAHYRKDELNQGIYSLMRARAGLMNLRLSLHLCARLWRKDKRVKRRLAELIKKIETAERRFPISVIGR